MSDRDDDRHEPDDLDPEAPASAEELAASERLRDALAGAPSRAAAEELELVGALRAAWAPRALSVDESRDVLEVTLTRSDVEEAHAVRLRDALDLEREPGEGDHDHLFVARALRSAFSPRALDESEHRAIVDAALAKLPAAPPARVAETIAAAVPITLGQRRATVRVAFGIVAGGLALAASIVLVVTSSSTHDSEAPLAKARTTQPLFTEPFRPGEASARIDRIASARASDFRDNRFTRWGVR
jgi:hypothetical protein